jgi:hypothetical protein
MGAFCTGCGGKLDPGAKFCPQCGQTVAGSQGAPTASAPVATRAASPPPITAAAPAKGGGGAAKIIFAVLGIFAFFVLAAAGSCFYIGYRVKKRAEEFAQTYKTTPYEGNRDACRLATKAEVATAFHMPVLSVENEGNSCVYDFGGSRRMAVQVTWEGGTLAMKVGHGALKSITGGMDTFTTLSGVGDEAYIEPMGSGVMLRKGDVMVNIDLRMANQNADAGKQIAAIVVSRL